MKNIEIFFSYSHKDEPLKDELLNHLSNLKRQSAIRCWHDRRIGAGREWANQIDEHLNSASIILLLVSADFMASDYCNDIEVRQALKRHEAGDARLIPIILKPVDWKGAVFEKLNALPKDALAVTKWADRDEAFVNIVEGIREAINALEMARLRFQYLQVDHKNIAEKIKLGERILELYPDFQIAKDLSMRSRLASLYISRGNAKKPDSYSNQGQLRGLLGGSTGSQADRQKAYERALADFERAIELCPHDPEPYFHRGELHSTKSESQSCDEVFDYSSAFADYTHAIELAPDNGKYYYARAELQNPEIVRPSVFKTQGGRMSKKRQLEADRDLQKAIRLGYLDPETRLPIMGDI